jgi:hypothetical protein
MVLRDKAKTGHSEIVNVQLLAGAAREIRWHGVGDLLGR